LKERYGEDITLYEKIISPEGIFKRILEFFLQKIIYTNGLINSFRKNGKFVRMYLWSYSLKFSGGTMLVPFSTVF